MNEKKIKKKIFFFFFLLLTTLLGASRILIHCGGVPKIKFILEVLVLDAWGPCGLKTPDALRDRNSEFFNQVRTDHEARAVVPVVAVHKDLFVWGGLVKFGSDGDEVAHLLLRWDYLGGVRQFRVVRNIWVLGQIWGLILGEVYYETQGWKSLH